MFDRIILDKGDHQGSYDEYENKINAVNSKIDEDLFNNHIVPFCKKWNLTFISGNGEAFFENNIGTIIYVCEEQVRQHPKATFLRKIYEIDQFISDVDQLTHFCGSGYKYLEETK